MKKSIFYGLVGGLCVAALVLYYLFFSGIPQSEQQALKDLFRAYHGESRALNSGWSRTETIKCTAYGINCDSSNHIISLDLSDKLIQGPFPSQVTRLP